MPNFYVGFIIIEFKSKIKKNEDALISLKSVYQKQKIIIIIINETISVFKINLFYRNI